MATISEPRKIGTIHVNGENRYILKDVKVLNRKRNQIIGLHECWYRWMPTRNDWAKTPSYYVKVV